MGRFTDGCRPVGGASTARRLSFGATGKPRIPMADGDNTMKTRQLTLRYGQGRRSFRRAKLHGIDMNCANFSKVCL
jgi:hypothetical protein